MSKPKKYSIQVRDAAGAVLKTIRRVVRCEQIGNFAPLFCTFNRDARCLVKSDKGDVSDPFRASQDYAESFFIVIA